MSKPSRRCPDALALYRLAQGFTQAELAREAGVTRATISRLERDKGRPQLATASAIAAALGVRIDTIFGDRFLTTNGDLHRSPFVQESAEKSRHDAG